MSSLVLRIEGAVLVGPQQTRPRVWVVDGRVTYAEPSRAGADVQVLRGWVLPGLVDAHCHVGLDARGAVDEPTTETQARTDRDAGTLLIRDAGSPADTRWVDRRGDLPRIIRAGRHLARPKRYQPGYAHEIEPGELHGIRSPGGAPRGRLGEGVGDWIDRDRGDLAPCWPRAALTEAVAAAHEEGARVTAHCFGEESLRDFAAAGTDCIEHACGLDDETTAVFAAQGIAIVPTLVNIATFPGIAERARAKFPAYGDHLSALHACRYQTVGAAHDAGIPVYVGTDAGGSLPHGLVAQEVLEEPTRAGLTPIEAIGAATWAARSWLGRPGIDEGAPADLVVFDNDPRVDVRVLAHPRHIVLRGVLV